MMKKLVILLTMIILSISSLCYAFEQPDPARWLWLYSDDKVGVWLDKHTYKTEKISRSIGHDGHDSANVWIQLYDLTKNQKSLQNFICDFKCNSIANAAIVLYDSNNELIDSYNSTYTQFKPLIPDSIGELIFASVKNIKDENVK